MAERPILPFHKPEKKTTQLHEVDYHFRENPFSRLSALLEQHGQRIKIQAHEPRPVTLMLSTVGEEGTQFICLTVVDGSQAQSAKIGMILYHPAKEPLAIGVAADIDPEAIIADMEDTLAS